MAATIFMKRPATAALNACITLQPKSHWRQKQGRVTKYFEAVNYLLETYANDNIIAETDAHIMHLLSHQISHPLNMRKHCGTSATM